MNKQELVTAVSRYHFVEVWAPACGAWIPVHRTRFLAALKADGARDLQYRTTVLPAAVYNVNQHGSILRIG
jgi:hypothetical protein